MPFLSSCLSSLLSFLLSISMHLLLRFFTQFAEFSMSLLFILPISLAIQDSLYCKKSYMALYACFGPFWWPPTGVDKIVDKLNKIVNKIGSIRANRFAEINIFITFERIA